MKVAGVGEGAWSLRWPGVGVSVETTVKEGSGCREEQMDPGCGWGAVETGRWRGGWRQRAALGRPGKSGWP